MGSPWEVPLMRQIKLHICLIITVCSANSTYRILTNDLIHWKAGLSELPSHTKRIHTLRLFQYKCVDLRFFELVKPLWAILEYKQHFKSPLVSKHSKCTDLRLRKIHFMPNELCDYSQELHLLAIWTMFWENVLLPKQFSHSYSLIYAGIMLLGQLRWRVRRFF